MTITQLVLNKLNLNPVLKKAHGKSPEISAYDFIDSILRHTTLVEVAFELKVGEQTVNRIVVKHLKPIFGKLNGGNETWKYVLLKSINYKECHTCNQIKPYSKFNTDIHTSDGKYVKCKYCRSIVNASMAANRKLRIPSWYESEKHLIAEFYENCPDGYHVDHIIPLQGKLVSGLHTLSNLQYLSAYENMKKGNKYCPDGEIW